MRDEGERIGGWRWRRRKAKNLPSVAYGSSSRQARRGGRKRAPRATTGYEQGGIRTDLQLLF